MPAAGAELLPLRIQITAIVLAIVWLAATFELVRKGRLREDYALLWLGGGLLMFVMFLWPGSIRLLARVTGVVYPPSAIFIVALVTIIWLLLHFSIIVSTLTARLVRLTQRLAILEMRLAEASAAAGGSTPEAHDVRPEQSDTTGSGSEEPGGGTPENPQDEEPAAEPPEGEEDQ
ncbi:MAG: DUF2304 domain-containing protein [Armatimonadetes bacterium]|nr:DUF2304 domain-containing protein [Armatimonadota bacterium]